MTLPSSKYTGLLLTGIFFFLFIPEKAHSQRFWGLTYEFWGGPKTGIASIGNRFLLVATENGVMRSENEGFSWEKTLEAPEVHCLYANVSGRVLAGGRGRIFLSTDSGSTWQTILQPHSFAITQIIEVQTGRFMAITGETTMDGYLGEGVFYSADGGLTWSVRNQGLRGFTAISKITSDSQGRVFLVTLDELARTQGGLFVSHNEGENWIHIPFRFDGRGIVASQPGIEFATHLKVHGDSLYLGFSGLAGSALVRMNLVQALSQIGTPAYWHQVRISGGSQFWMDRLFNSLYFARNGDRYSSVSGSISGLYAGTYFSKPTSSWIRTDRGLGTDVLGNFGPQEFTGLPSGKVFMIQRFDERIYQTDTSQIFTPISPSLISENPKPALFPNPSTAGEHISLVTNGIHFGSIRFSAVDLQGKKTELTTNEAGFEAPKRPGVYRIRIQTGTEIKDENLLVR